VNQKTEKYTRGAGSGLGALWTMAVVTLLANYWVKSIPSWIIEYSTWLFFAGLIVLAVVLAFAISVYAIAKTIRV
jgi:hypothetical protein